MFQDDDRISIAADGSIRYYHTDALGSVIALTDENAAVKTQYIYSPFGETAVIALNPPFS
jgi:hypothetical protein